jgi:hypothetical protein
MRMKTYPLLAAGALALLSFELPAYQIVESYFHVEVAPNKYVDQLVLRCEDGHQIIVPWASKLAESCGEDLMGNVTLPRDKPGPVDEEQKQAMLTQLRSQYGNISEKQVEFVQGPAGLTTRFKPPIVEVLKKYEACRKTQKDKAFCAGERDRALAKLADPEPAVPQADAQKPAAAQADAQKPAAAQADVQKPVAPHADAQKPPAPEPDARTTRPEPTLAAVSAQQADPVATASPAQALPAEPAPAAAAPPSDAEARANAERKIAADYASCMRAKPKYECDQSRAKAIGALENPKPAKPQRQRKQASAAVETQATR